MDGLYSTIEVAAFMGVSYETVQKLIKGGKIKAINISRGKKKIYRIKAEDVQTYYDQIQSAIDGPEGVHE